MLSGEISLKNNHYYYYICSVNKDKVQSLLTERSKYVFKRYLDADSDGAYLTTFG